MDNIIFVLLIVLAFASERSKNETENKKTSKYIGVTFHKSHSNWRAIRWSKYDFTMTYSGPYKDEETAAHASDTLARKLKENGEHGHKLNFPSDHTEVYPDEIKDSRYIGVSYNKRCEKWCTYRYSKNENKVVCNGYYKDQETAAHASDTLAKKLTANGEKYHKLNFPDDDTEVWRPEKIKPSSNYIGVSYNTKVGRWYVQRYSKNEKKAVCNGKYKDEEIAAHASDTLAKQLLGNGEHGHKLNFPNDQKQVHPQKIKTSKFIGVSYNKRDEIWCAQRHSKNENKVVCNGTYKDEESAARASDTLAWELMENGEHGHKLNFPGDHNEMKTSKFFGVTYSKRDERWYAQRRSKDEKKTVHNGYYKNEETAAHASDTLARELMAYGEKNHKLNFPGDYIEVHQQKTKTSRYIGVSYNERDARWYAQRHSKTENKAAYNGYYKDEKTAAHASDTLARRLMENGEKNHKLNFPHDHAEVSMLAEAKKNEYQRNKRKRSDHEHLKYFQNK